MQAEDGDPACPWEQERCRVMRASESQS